MIKLALVPILAAMALAAPAMAQDSGGVQLAPGVTAKGGPHGLARLLPFTAPPFLSAHDAQNGLTAADHQALNQNTISKLRGDAGFLGGFSFGTPLSASVQNQAVQGGFGNDGGYYYRHQHQGNGPVIINNQGPLALTVGNGNVVQQQSANGSGPIAQQQVATLPGAQSGAGARNLITGAGNIIQSAPGRN